MEGSEWGRPPDGTWQVGRVELTPLLDHGMQKSLGSEPNELRGAHFKVTLILAVT